MGTQPVVGSLAGAMIYAYQTDVARLSDSLPLLNAVLIVLVTLLLSFFGAVIMGLVAGLYPAFRASSMKPIEAIRRGE